jgi:hypothetical protein
VLAAACLAAVGPAGVGAVTPTHPDDLGVLFAHEVAPRLDLPASERAPYAARLRQMLAIHAVAVERTQVVLLVDRNAHVQAAMLWWVAPDGAAGLIGAAPVSTGRPAGFEHFETPIGVFAHSLAHPDFRAEGTRNALGIRGYGERGMRVYDFGWVVAPRAWKPGLQAMRLQVHATDPRLLEPRLGQRESKGCIRIPAALNDFIDRYALLDADYAAAEAAGRRLWVLRPDRQPAPWPGRWLVVVDSLRVARPDWSPWPGAHRPAGGGDRPQRDSAGAKAEARVAGSAVGPAPGPRVAC